MLGTMSPLLALSVLLSYLFTLTSSQMAYSDKCPRIQPVTGLKAKECTGQYHDGAHASTTPYMDARYCNYATGEETMITNFTATTAQGPWQTVITWSLGENDGDIKGTYVNVTFGYYAKQLLWFLGAGPDYYCVYACTEDKATGNITEIFQYEPRGCVMTPEHSQRMADIMKRNNLNFTVMNGTTSACQDDIGCPSSFNGKL